MSLRQLPLMELDWQPPASSVVAAALLDNQLEHASALRHAQREASSIIKAACRKAEQIVRHANRQLREQQEAVQLELARSQQAMFERYEVEWLASHVASLRDDDALEQHIIQAVSARIHRSIEQVLTAWFQGQPSDDILCSRLTEQVEKMAQDGALALHIHPEMEAQVRDTFGERLTVGVNSSLARDEAILASAQHSVSFSLSRHFQQLLDWLLAPCETEMPDSGAAQSLEDDDDGEI